MVWVTVHTQAPVFHVKHLPYLLAGIPASHTYGTDMGTYGMGTYTYGGT